MRTFRADLHIHTVLSPCGDLDMSPVRIVEEAAAKKLDIIGVTDHNTTRHCRLVRSLALKKGIFVMTGAEITTKEEVHCLAFFENDEKLKLLQDFIDANLPDMLNIPEIFGEQLEVDENEIIIYEEKRLLANAVKKSINEVEAFVHSLDGIFIPAHVDRMKNSIYSQLGMLPDNLKADALEVSRATTTAKFAALHPEISKYPVTRSSDSHYPDSIGQFTTAFFMKEASFSEIRLALAGAEGRKIIQE
ncbi:MAG TPA: PHP domain-containing protein [Bacteroidales bacterium]|nr:PHP domain-containing protein [Bacteroidales bacterium]